MTKEKMEVFMQNFFDTRIMASCEAGQKEYAGDENSDAFTNFNTLATDLGIDRKHILWMYAMKHRDGIAAYLRGHTSQREHVSGRIQDLIVYLLLLAGMIEEEETSVPIPLSTGTTTLNLKPDTGYTPYPVITDDSTTRSTT